MSNEKNPHFSDADIDAIAANPTDNFFTPVLQEALTLIDRPSQICDVGCGNGVFSACLKDLLDCSLSGVDGSAYALQHAGKRGFDELHLVKDFSSDRLPFKDDTFDLVINKDVLEHLLNPEILVAEMVRIIKPGGHFLVLVPNHFPISGRLQLLAHNTIDPFGYFPDARRWNFPHIRFFNKNDFLLLMESKGLKPVRCLSHHFPSFPKIGRLMPSSMKERLSHSYPDAFAEAFVWLFQKPSTLPDTRQ